MDRRARAIAARLHDMRAFGERILLLYAPGLESIAAFFGCLYAGAIAVPAYRPHPPRLPRTLPRLRAIADDARARFLFTTSDIVVLADAIAPNAPAQASLHWIATDEISVENGALWRCPDVHAIRLLSSNIRPAPQAIRKA